MRVCKDHSALEDVVPVVVASVLRHPHARIELCELRSIAVDALSAQLPEALADDLGRWVRREIHDATLQVLRHASEQLHPFSNLARHAMRRRALKRETTCSSSSL